MAVIPGVQNASTTISGSSGTFNTGNTSYTAVTNLSVTVTNKFAKSKWHIFCESDASTNFSSFGIGGGGSPDHSTIIGVFRNGSEIATYRIRNFQGTNGGYNFEPSSELGFLDIDPPVGSNTYDIRIYTLNGTGSLAYAEYIVLVARQLE